MTAAEYRKWAKEQLESATKYAEWAKDCEQSAKFWFAHRGPFDAVETWGESSERRYDICRKKFLMYRRLAKAWRKTVTECIRRHAEYVEKAQSAARREKLNRLHALDVKAGRV